MFDRKDCFDDSFIFDPITSMDRRHGLTKSNGICLEESGKMQLARISGWLRGLIDSKESQAYPFAFEALKDLKKVFAMYRQEKPEMIDVGPFLLMPKDVVIYTADSPFGCFDVAWARLIENEAAEDLVRPGRRLYYAEEGKVAYEVYINGGLIYSGPGGDQTFTIQVGKSSDLWTYHT